MKKFFTLLFTVVTMLSAFTVKADEIVMQIGVYDSKTQETVSAAKDWTTNLTRTVDNVYTIENFLNSGQAVSFTFGEFTDSYAKVEITSKTLATSKNYPYFYGGNKYMTCVFEGLTEDEEITDMEYTYYYKTTREYPYVYQYSDAEAEQYGFKYYFFITIEGFENTNTYDVSFYFNEPEAQEPEPAPEVVSVQDIVLSIENADDATAVLKTCPTTLTYWSNGVYTIGDFMNSGAPLSFTFEEPGTGYSVMPSLVDNVNESYTGYFDILSPETGDNVETKAETEGGVTSTIYYPYIYMASGYDYIYDQSADAGATKQYEGFFTTSGYSNTSTWADADWYYVTFYFDGPKQSGIADVIASDDEAPVEYYNLNGVRVQNPSAGLYIRKQGGDVKKVIIR